MIAKEKGQEKSLRTYQGAVSIITGAASGIGRALAEELARRESEVVLADLQFDLAEAVASTLQGEGKNAQAVKLDVTDAVGVDALIHKTFERTGRLDYLFNNAGIGMAGPIGLHSLKDWDRILDVNLRGVINGIHSTYPIMLRQGFGHIVNTASFSGLIPTPGMVTYSATKYAVVGLSTSLRAEIAATGIRVSVLCPGMVRTAVLAGGGRYGKVYSDLSTKEQLEIAEKLRPMAPDLFARKALDAIARNASIIVIPARWKLFWWLNRLSPDLLMFVMQKMLGDNLPRNVRQQN